MGDTKSRFHPYRYTTMAYFQRPLYRSRRHRMLGGVVGGLAEYFDIDPTLARVLFFAASVMSAAFPGMLVYVALWVVVPEQP